MLGMGALVSCEDDTGTAIGTPYNPSQPVKLTSFEPDSGGMATKLFIDGANFGNDPTAVKVYFNKTRANVVGSDGEHLYVITPRQPGDTCVISVVVGKDSTTFEKTFRYKTMITVSTIAGVTGDYTYKVNCTLAEARFDKPSTLCLDSEGNIFISHWRTPYSFVVVNIDRNIVQELHNGTPLGAPTADADNLIIVPDDSGDRYYTFDPQAEWTPKQRTILHPTADEVAAGKLDWAASTKHGFAACMKDGLTYCRNYAGYIIKFDPKTRKGERVFDLFDPNTDSFLFFDPFVPTLLYISLPSLHCIKTIDVETGEKLTFAGKQGQSGYADGDRLDALFNRPVQICMDDAGVMLVADQNNHCIRRITTDGKVSTAIGKGGVKGSQDGNAEDALFNGPKGVAIDKDNNIYVVEFGEGTNSDLAGHNNRLRVLAIQ
ncbi:MAG: IPT/TIG domain-containing protein [Bacteroidales bacterium]|nr:IPT/TIG domain-containing protein [Bacteroidales bacterium]